MKDTTNNLLIFLLANNGISVDSDCVVVNTHTPLGDKIIGELVFGKATTNMTQARFFKSRKERWEHLKKRNPALDFLEKELM